MRATRFVAVVLMTMGASVAAMAANDCKQVAPPGACHIEQGYAQAIMTGLTVATESGKYFWDETDDALAPWSGDFVDEAVVIGDMEICDLGTKHYSEVLDRAYGCVASISNPVEIKKGEPRDAICKRTHWNCPAK